ncbi:hypothetical protein D3C85_1303310 [compost metagenome]
MTVAHDPAAIDQHVAYLAVCACKQPAIENGIRAGGSQVRVIAIEHQPIGALAHRQFADRLPQRLGTAAQGGVVQRTTDHRLIAAVQPVAALVPQALTVFQPAQFFHHAQ